MNLHESALDRALHLHRSGNVPAAQEQYHQILQQDPENADAWCFLGVAYREQGRLDEALAAYRNAIRIQPDSAAAFNNMGNTLFQQLRLEEAVACYGEAIRRQPAYARAFRNRSVALQWAGRPAEALADCRRVVQLDPDDVEAHVHLGQALLLQGQFEFGWREYAWRLKMHPHVWARYTLPLWDGSSLDGKTILLAAEQGLGDTIQFIRYAAVLKAKYSCRVVVACQSPLLALLRCCEGIDELVASDRELPVCDVYTPLLHLPALLPEHSGVQPPYLLAEPELERLWKARLSSFTGFKIGIVWQGNPARRYDAWRSFPLGALSPLSRLENMHLFSLQKGHGSEQLDRWAEPAEVIPLGDALDEESGAFLETAAVLKNLDLLISADTAVAHLAGALGVPVWLALPVAPDWRWQLHRNDSPWYPTFRLFRQTTLNNWNEVFEAMAGELAERLPDVRLQPAKEPIASACGMTRMVRSRHGLMIINHRDRYIGRSLERYREYSEGECNLFERLLGKGDVVVEAGSNIGAHTLALSELVGGSGRIHAFEPQRNIYHMLRLNVALNGRANVDCRCEALSDTQGWLRVPAVDYCEEGNFGGISLSSTGDGEPVRAVTIDSLHLPQCRLIKVDVEGMELPVLRGAARTIRRLRPLLYVENDREERSAELIRHILGLGYDLYWHIVPLYNPANLAGNAGNAFPGIVSVNLLGVHRSLPMKVEDLPRVKGALSNWRSPGAI